MFEKKTELECLLRFNSQLRVWVTGSGAMRGGPASTLFRYPPATPYLRACWRNGWVFVTNTIGI